MAVFDLPPDVVGAGISAVRTVGELRRTDGFGEAK